jgi:hypothetical protein
MGGESGHSSHAGGESKKFKMDIGYLCGYSNSDIIAMPILCHELPFEKQ